MEKVQLNGDQAKTDRKSGKAPVRKRLWRAGIIQTEHASFVSVETAWKTYVT
jgi:hypothetical protein